MLIQKQIRSQEQNVTGIYLKTLGETSFIVEKGIIILEKPRLPGLNQNTEVIDHVQSTDDHMTHRKYRVPVFRFNGPLVIIH